MNQKSSDIMTGDSLEKSEHKAVSDFTVVDISITTKHDGLAGNKTGVNDAFVLTLARPALWAPWDSMYAM